MSGSVFDKETFLMSMALEMGEHVTEHVSTSASIEVRGRDAWRGIYQQVLDLVWNGTEEVGTGALPRENLKFFSVATNELDKATQNQQLLWFVIPTSWLSLDGRYLLYPPADFQISGKSPNEWKGNVFKRYAFPRSYWLESDLASIINAGKPVKLAVAVKAALAATRGVSKEEMEQILLSDSERAFGRNQRVHKKRKTGDVLSSASVIADSSASADAAVGESLESANPVAVKSSSSLNKISDEDLSSSESEEDFIHPLLHKRPIFEFQNMLSGENNGLPLNGVPIPNAGGFHVNNCTPTFPEYLQSTTSAAHNPFMPFGLQDLRTSSTNNGSALQTPFSSSGQGPSPSAGSALQTISSMNGETSPSGSASHTTFSRNGRGPSPSGSAQQNGMNRGPSPSESAQQNGMNEGPSPSGSAPQTVSMNGGPPPGYNSERRYTGTGPSSFGSVHSTGSSFSMSNLLSSASDDSQLDAQGGMYLNANAVSQINQVLQTVNNSEKVLNECKTLFATKLDEILKKMAHLNVRDLPARIQSHSTAHEVQVKAKLAGLPYDRIRDLMAMDTLLIDLNLAISLVGFFFHKFKTSKDVKQLFKKMYRSIFTDAVSNKLQWRGSPKLNDQRAGISNMLHIMSVLATTCNVFNNIHNTEKMTLSQIEEQTKLVRKARGGDYRKKNKITSAEAATAAATPSLDDQRDADALREEFDTLTVWDQKVTALEKAFMEFTLPE